MEVSKIQLSAAEGELAQNAEIILTKNSVLQKMKAMLEQVQEQHSIFLQQQHLTTHELFVTAPKISKGENYLGLPYLVLDHPRTASGAHLFFIRTMFWWGKHFSVTLHLGGCYRELYGPVLQKNRALFNHCFVGINADPWIHHFEPDNFRPVADLSREAFSVVCESLDHLKIGITVPLGNWHQVPEQLVANWALFLEACGLTANAV